MLKAEPMRKYRSPVYPARREVERSPELLRRNIPRGWRNRAGMAAALAVCLSAATASLAQEKSDTPSGSGTAADTSTPEKKLRCGIVTVGITSDYTDRSYEEDAWNLIKSVLRKSGIKLKNGREPAGTGDMIIWSAFEGKIETGTPAEQARKFQIDGFDPKHRVGVRVVSFPEMFRSELRLVPQKEKEAPASPSGGTPVYVGVFEDAISTFECDASWREKQRQRKEAKRLLRQQVADFVAWLKAQGVI